MARKLPPLDLAEVRFVEGPYTVAADGVTITSDCGCVELARVIRKDDATLPAAACAIRAVQADATTRLFVNAPDVLDALRDLTMRLTRGRRADNLAPDVAMAIRAARALIDRVEVGA